MNEASNDDNWNQNDLSNINNKNKRLLTTVNYNDYNDYSLIKNQNKSINMNNRNKENSSWSSNDSFSEDGNENSIYDSSLELNQEID